MIKNFIFDFGEVLVKFNTKYMTSVYANPEDVSLIEDVVFDRLYWDSLDKGTITDDEVRKGICSRLPKALHETACKVYDNWYNNLPFIDGMPELLKEIKQKGGKLFLLSNISIGFANNYATVPEIKEFFDMFDGLVFSGPIGITKPNAEIFEHLLNKYNLKAEESAFIDDRIDNVLGADRVGINGILFDGDVKALRSKILK